LRPFPPSNPAQSPSASLVHLLRDCHLDVPSGSSAPHFHAQYGEAVAQIELATLRVIGGSLPPRALRLVRQWARLHMDELSENWERAQALEPLVAVDPLP
jgi:hypothetical protein